MDRLTSRGVGVELSWTFVGTTVYFGNLVLRLWLIWLGIVSSSCHNQITTTAKLAFAFLIMTKTFFLRIWCALALAASPILLVGCEKSLEERSRGGSSADPKVPDPAELPSVPDPAELPSVPDPAELPNE
jgi:hypothetical protein